MSGGGVIVGVVAAPESAAQRAVTWPACTSQRTRACDGLRVGLTVAKNLPPKALLLVMASLQPRWYKRAEMRLRRLLHQAGHLAQAAPFAPAFHDKVS